MDIPPERSRHGITHAVVVRGRLSPVLRAALVAGQPITTVETCSVLCVRDDADRDLTDVVGLLDGAQLRVQEVHLVPHALTEPTPG
jgi:hypothetical protein